MQSSCALAELRRDTYNFNSKQESLKFNHLSSPWAVELECCWSTDFSSSDQPHYSSTRVSLALPVKEVPELEKWRLDLMTSSFKMKSEIFLSVEDIKSLCAMIDSLCCTWAELTSILLHRVTPAPTLHSLHWEQLYKLRKKSTFYILFYLTTWNLTRRSRVFIWGGDTVLKR